MASATLSFVSICAGGEHIVGNISSTTPTVNIDVSMTKTEFSAPLTADEIATAMRVILRFKKADDGLTNAQLLSALQSGITVSL